MVLAIGIHGYHWNVLRWQEEVGSIPLVDCDGVPVDCVCYTDQDVWVHSWLCCLHGCVHKEREAMEKQ